MRIVWNRERERKICKHCSKWLRNAEVARFGNLCNRCGENIPSEQREQLAERTRIEGDGERVKRLRAMPYARYVRTREWTRRRARKLNDAGKRCQVCNSKKILEVHHRNYERIGCERDNDLTVLCNDCHAKFHDKLPKGQIE
jgi:RNA polymerase-binding transcription factor DksA